MRNVVLAAICLITFAYGAGNGASSSRPPGPTFTQTLSQGQTNAMGSITVMYGPSKMKKTLNSGDMPLMLTVKDLGIDCANCAKQKPVTFTVQNNSQMKNLKINIKSSPGLTILGSAKPACNQSVCMLQPSDGPATLQVACQGKCSATDQITISL